MRHGKSKQPNAIYWRITENYTNYGKMLKRLSKIMMN